jgi:hypothetical protein
LLELVAPSHEKRHLIAQVDDFIACLGQDRADERLDINAVDDVLVSLWHHVSLCMYRSVS